MSDAEMPDSPGQKTYWFPAKTYGWGWGLPQVWQGWVVLAVFVALVAGGVVILPPQSEKVGFLAYQLTMAALFLVVCWLKGEPPGWRWGGK